jgi:hypothetical protein
MFNCGVHFVQWSTPRLLSTVKSVANQKRGPSIIVVKARHVTNMLNEVDACMVNELVFMNLTNFETWQNSVCFGN